MSSGKKQSTEAAVREIRRKTRRKFAPEEKIRIVLEGLRGEEEVSRQYHASPIGSVDGVVERFYAISAERRVTHPAVAAICTAARTKLFD